VSTAKPKNPRRPYPVARLLSRVPRALRNTLPVELLAGGNNIELATVYLPNLGGAMPDRGGWEAIAQMPELAEHYRDGWRYVHADQVDQGASLEVFLWREVTP
jgi:hypothetical protein